MIEVGDSQQREMFTKWGRLNEDGQLDDVPQLELPDELPFSDFYRLTLEWTRQHPKPKLNASPGLELVPEEEWDTTEIDCVQHAFRGKGYGRERWSEPWYSFTPEVHSVLLSVGGIALLEANGFVATDMPTTNDVVVYLKLIEDAYIPVHYGRVLEDGRIESKFGGGPVYRHEVGEVPLQYGDGVLFMRKTIDPKAPPTQSPLPHSIADDYASLVGSSI